MPTPRSKKVRKPAEVLAPVPDAILDQFAPEGMLTAADLKAATRRFKKALLERARGAELGHHLAQEAGQSSQWLECEARAHPETPATGHRR